MLGMGGERLSSGLPSSSADDHFRSAILDAWRFQVFARFSERQSFLEGEFCDFHGSLHLLTSSHLRDRDKMLLRAVFVWGRLERIPSW